MIQKNFEDSGIYYASQNMSDNDLILSMTSGIIYKFIANETNVKIHKIATNDELINAQQEIEKDNDFIGEALVYLDKNSGKLYFDY